MSRYEDIEQRLADWLEDGPSGAPDLPIAAALAHARAHPRRRWSAVGHWRTLMSGTNMTQVGPKAPQAGWLYAATAVLVILVVVAGGYGILQAVNPGGGVGGMAGEASPVPTATPAPTAALITGTEDCSTGTGATTVTIDGVKQSRNERFDCINTMSDPRLTGGGTATMNSDEYPDGTWIGWGTRDVTNDGGSWHSVWSATSTTTASVMEFEALLVGADGYAGLVAPVSVRMDPVRGTTSSARILDAPAAITGHETCVFDDTNDREFTVGDITAYRGVVGTCTDTMSDPRLSGTGRNEVSIDMRPDGSADIWGTYVLTNDDGTWEGRWSGTVDTGYTTHRVEALLVGTAEYEGLLYRLTLVSDASGASADLTGLIVPRP